MRYPLGRLAIRIQRNGCANRPFYHIVVTKKGLEMQDPPMEQIGIFEPMPNEQNEKLISFNFERLKYWLGYGCYVSTPVRELLGLCGFTAIHPRTYMVAWRNQRMKKLEESKKLDESKSAEANVDDKEKETQSA